MSAEAAEAAEIAENRGTLTGLGWGIQGAAIPASSVAEPSVAA